MVQALAALIPNLRYPRPALLFAVLFTAGTSVPLATAGPRARDLGVPFDGTPGPLNTITDVVGVEVGFTTVIEGSGKGDDWARTGVTVVFPLGKDDLAGVPAACFAFNGVGEMTGTHFVQEYGILYTPILITNTLSVGVAHDTYLRWARERIDSPADLVARALPVVAETWDGFLNDIYGFHIKPDHVLAALGSARSGVIAEGNIGGGTGMRAFQFKAGTGTSSRTVEIDSASYTLGVLVQANFGRRHELCIAGIPVGKLITDLMPSGGDDRDGGGSIIAVVGTDAPLLPHQLQRLARRAALAIGRVGGVSNNTSGDLFMAFSTANATRFGDSPVRSYTALAHEIIDPLFAATVQATEEAIINSLVAAETMSGVGGRTVHALPHDRLRQILAMYPQLPPEVRNHHGN
jgi:L-aminopeptidase/D-esterase-like protein